MKKIIDGKKYDTDTAKRVGAWDNGYIYGDLDFHEEELYRKSNGEFFMMGWSGARGAYATRDGNGMRGGGAIVPLSDAEARAWAERHLDADAYEALFGAVPE